ncbi:virulence factor [Dyadobacter luteus]|uniref:Virulence factor n=1 Tax=Dyadobacter luteus TaxID=2259619 RepID=A0A3D8YHX3_9BACT|nr:AcvB/VirJ family lysyl-phosphatidylglycerol hydrolase [Dyadobacter luteus]REA64275.1 virulence factor [Dyadobacter luteus]
MKKPLALFLVFLLACQIAHAGTIDSIVYGSFGKIILYHPSIQPTSVALFVSGDGGWESGVIEMAKNIAAQGALVLGIDARNYKKSLNRQTEGCLYPAADFENLSLMIQKKYQFPQYLKPVLVGYSYGATLIYGILAQAPANTFKGALALGFCPDIEIAKPLCKGTALSSHLTADKKTYWLEKTSRLTAPFIALNGLKDLNCPYASTKQFLEKMPMAELVTLPKVGHGFSVNTNWLPQFNIAYKQILRTQSFTEQKSAQNALLQTQKTALLPGSLPLTLIPSAQKNDMPLVFFISGDGGWTSFDQSLAENLAKSGMPVVGMDAQKYFWKEKSPGQSAADVSKAIVHYMQQWSKREFVLMGFSFGASVVPFIADRLSSDIQKNIKGVISLSPDENADFEIHITDMLNLGQNNGQYNVLAEMIKIKDLKPACIFGGREDSQVKDKLKKEGIKTIILPGGHHYNDDYAALTTVILSNIRN